MKDLINQVILGNAFEIINQIEDNTIDLILTDPPYFLDKLDDKWSHDNVKKGEASVGVVKNLPVGMKYDPQQSYKAYEWFYKISKDFIRILKPGGWLLVFSHPRLYHRFACAAEDVGFHLRDTFIWLYTQNQPKAFSLKHFLKEEEQDNELANLLEVYKVPKVKSCFEPIIVAQKPPEGSLLENFKKYKVGLFNTSVKFGDGKFPANVISTDSIEPRIDKYFLIEKPKKEEKGSYNDHPSVKPVELCKILIELTTLPDAIVLDPFMGSGTTILASILTNRRYIGVELNEHYYNIAMKRISELKV
jgi:site-specific DNA-methyltransferase (adenine-specific)